MDRCMRSTLLAISLCLILGCGSKPDQPYLSADYSSAFNNQSATANKKQQTTDEPENTVTRRILSPSDPPVIFKPTVNLSIYHLRVPLGTVSGSEEFWKRVDEHAVDVSTYDVLFKNGIRVGRAPISELDAFLKILDRNTMQTLPTVFVASGAKTIELPMKKAAMDQVLYDFDLKNTLTVRSYEECNNIF